MTILVLGTAQFVMVLDSAVMNVSIFGVALAEDGEGMVVPAVSAEGEAMV